MELNHKIIVNIFQNMESNFEIIISTFFKKWN